MKVRSAGCTGHDAETPNSETRFDLSHSPPHRWTERDQTGHLQPSLWAAGNEEPWHRDIGRTHQATRRSCACSAERRAEAGACYTFLTMCDMHLQEPLHYLLKWLSRYWNIQSGSEAFSYRLNTLFFGQKHTWLNWIFLNFKHKNYIFP